MALICAMIYNAHMHVKKVEEGYRKMEELKVQAEAADIAKSQVFFSRHKLDMVTESAVLSIWLWLWLWL